MQDKLSTAAPGPPLQNLAAPERPRDVQRLAFTRAEAAHLLGISKPSLDRAVSRGLLRPSRALRRPLFSRAELERFLAETTGEPR